MREVLFHMPNLEVGIKNSRRGARKLGGGGRKNIDWYQIAATRVVRESATNLKLSDRKVRRGMSGVDQRSPGRRSVLEVRIYWQDVL